MPARYQQRVWVREYITDLRYLGRTREADALAAVLADSEALAARDAGVADEFALDLIMWSLRLPLLREAIGRVEARPGVLTGNTTELARLDALIAEGERALGILPPEKEAS